LAGFTLCGADAPSTVSELCACQARITISRDVASEVRPIAKEYQKQAADLHGGKMPGIADVDEERSVSAVVRSTIATADDKAVKSLWHGRLAAFGKSRDVAPARPRGAFLLLFVD
jgi:hypothetical protein